MTQASQEETRPNSEEAKMAEFDWISRLVELRVEAQRKLDEIAPLESVDVGLQGAME